jgi:hypothetical protein
VIADDRGAEARRLYRHFHFAFHEVRSWPGDSVLIADNGVTTRSPTTV